MVNRVPGNPQYDLDHLVLRSVTSDRSISDRWCVGLVYPEVEVDLEVDWVEVRFGRIGRLDRTQPGHACWRPPRRTDVHTYASDNEQI